MNFKQLLSFAFVAVPLMTSAQNVIINEINFPDEVFRNYLLEQDYGKDGVITEEEIKRVYKIDISNRRFSGDFAWLDGIEFFTALKELNCSQCNLYALNLSKNTSLTTLNCSSNNRLLLNISGCNSLTYLDCSDNNLTSLDVSDCNALTYLDCSQNTIVSLDVFDHTALTTLDCSGNSMISLDASGCTSLTSLKCTNSHISSLNVSGCTSLKSLDCSNIFIGQLNVSGCTSLASLDCSKNSLYSFDMSGCTSLKSLDCSNNSLHSLDVSDHTALTSLKCTNSYISSLNVSGCTSLIDLDFSQNNNLTSVNVSGCSALPSLNCHNNHLTDLNVSDCAALTSLDCSSNDLTDLNASGCSVLAFLDCRNNQLISLDVSGCRALTELLCNENQIKGSYMDALIDCLTQNTSDEPHNIYLSQNISIYHGEEGNVCTRSQAIAIREKGWTPCYMTGDIFNYISEYDGTVTVSVGADGLSTFVPHFNVDFSESTKIAAYKASVSGNTVLLERVMTVAAGEGVLLRSLNGGEATEVLPVEEAEKSDDNAFVGVYYDIVLQEKDGDVTNFVLSKVDGVVGFFKANDTRVPAWKAYLPVENYNAEASVKGLQIVFSDATGIYEVEPQPSATTDDAFYTLGGVRVANPTSKGIYIHNGKKLIIK